MVLGHHACRRRRCVRLCRAVLPEHARGGARVHGCGLHYRLPDRGVRRQRDGPGAAPGRSAGNRPDSGLGWPQACRRISHSAGELQPSPVPAGPGLARVPVGRLHLVRPEHPAAEHEDRRLTGSDSLVDLADRHVPGRGRFHRRRPVHPVDPERDRRPGASVPAADRRARGRDALPPLEHGLCAACVVAVLCRVLRHAIGHPESGPAVHHRSPRSSTATRPARRSSTAT